MSVSSDERNARLDGPIHGWFGLTYANYQVLPRTLMQSMPVEWQERMVACLRELDAAYTDQPHPDGYLVQARNLSGKIVKDGIPHYNRGRTFVPRVQDRLGADTADAVGQPSDQRVS